MALVPDASKLVTATPTEYRRTADEALHGARERIAALKAMAAPRDPVRALEAYDEATAAVSDTAARASVVRNAHPEAAMRQHAEECEQQAEKLATEISLDRGVYDALSAIDLSAQDASTRKWVEKVLRDFRRAGVDRDQPTRERVRALNEELVKIGQEFDRNIREDVRWVEVDPADLAGLPEDYVRNHKPQANGKVRITSDYPDYVPFMTYAKSGSAREALWRVYRQRAHPKNLSVLDRLVAGRHELANLLGYPSWAAYATEDKMIRSAQAAGEFIEKIAEAAQARAGRDFATLLERKRKETPGAERVNPWDQQYLENRIRAEDYGYDAQAARQYFEYTRVQQGVLDTTARMFGLTYRKVPEAPVWHPEVEAYDVLEGETLLGRFFLDMHPREGKYKHAAQFTLTSGKRDHRLPEGVLMCNFPLPGAEPALMEHGDVETFFHEFGHLLHHILGGNTRWAGLSGVRTEWDFVEAPSQMLEEWAWDPGTLQSFGKHVESGEPIPSELVLRMKKADEFGKGLWVRQQMFYAALSLNLYQRDPGQLDSTRLVKEMQERYTPFRFIDGTFFHLSFGHLDGYSAIYYTYMWSLVIAKDLFTVFKQQGLMDREAATRYRRHILQPGGSKDAADLVKDFLGRLYGFDAYEQWLNAA